MKYYDCQICPSSSLNFMKFSENIIVHKVLQFEPNLYISESIFLMTVVVKI